MSASRIAQIAIAALAIVALVGCIWLTANKIEVPTYLISAQASLVTALLGLAVPRGDETPAPRAPTPAPPPG